MLLRSLIGELNQKFEGIIPGLKAFGIAQSIVRPMGSEEELLPGVADINGEITYVGIDDTNPVSLYHRIAGVTTSRVTNKQGYGDGYSDLINSYQMAMIVFIDHKKTKLFPEELFLFLQANIPDAIKSDPYKTITLRTTNVILNSQLIFRAEYAGTAFKLPVEKSLFQINYVIESTFKKDCFAKCPEDC